METVSDIPADEIQRGLLTGVRVLPVLRLLDDATREAIEAQDALLSLVVAKVCAAVGAPMPEELLGAHRTIPPGWWVDRQVMGITRASGLVTLPACGQQGVPIDHRDDDGRGHGAYGLDASAWAVIATHEAAHAAHDLMVGFGAMSAALHDPARQPGSEVPGFLDFVGFLHRRMTGHRLPEGYDAARWPLGAPAMAGRLEQIAVTVLPFAVPPAPRAMPYTEAEWAEAHRLSFAADVTALLAERAAAAEWRAQWAEASA